MAEPNSLSNTYWQNKTKSKKSGVKSKDSAFNCKVKKIRKEDAVGFDKISKGNLLSKFTIITSVFSFLLEKYFEEFQATLLVYASNNIGLKNNLILDLNTKDSNSFKEFLQKTAAEVKETFVHADYDNSDIQLESFSNFSIQFENSLNVKNDDVTLVFEEIENEINFTIYYASNYKENIIESLLENLCRIISDYDEIIDFELKSFSICTDNEKSLLQLFNDTNIVYPSDVTVLDL
uniref:hypothetical protein n=1 Tax=Flavobacterium sp. H122 TaxID=2529860 RepID=UPI0010AA8F92